MTTGVRKYEPIFPNPKMSRLAWLVTHLQIVPLLLAYRFSTRGGPEPITMGGLDALSLVGCFVKKPCPKWSLWQRNLTDVFAS